MQPCSAVNYPLLSRNDFSSSVVSAGQPIYSNTCDNTGSLAVAFRNTAVVTGICSSWVSLNSGQSSNSSLSCLFTAVSSIRGRRESASAFPWQWVLLYRIWKVCSANTSAYLCSWAAVKMGVPSPGVRLRPRADDRLST